MANGVHRSRKRETYFGLFASARAAHSAGSSRVRPPAPGPVPRADRREGGSELENTFLLLLLFFSPASPPPLPLLAFSPPTAPFPPPPLLPRLLLLPHNLKKEGAARQLPSSGGIRGRCQFTTRGAANAKRGGRGGLNTAAAEPNNTRGARGGAARAAGEGAADRARRGEGARPPSAAPAPPPRSGGPAGSPGRGTERGGRLGPRLASLPGPRTAAAVRHLGPAAAVISFCRRGLALPGPGTAGRASE